MCILKAYSSKRSFEEYAKATALPVYGTREKGEVRSAKNGTVRKDYSISFDVSRKDWDDFPGQVQDAIAFLKRWEADLRSFNDNCLPEAFCLDFPLWSRINDSIVNQNDHLPAELIRSAGILGMSIEMAIYSREACSDS
jgi:hypothetical protein